MLRLSASQISAGRNRWCEILVLLFSAVKTERQNIINSILYWLKELSWSIGLGAQKSWLNISDMPRVIFRAFHLLF